jgi:hypothetical protein
MPWTREFFADIFIYSSFCRLGQSALLFCFFFSDDEDPKKFAATAPVTDAPIVDEPPSQEAAVVPKSPKAAAKKASFRASKRLKKASTASTSLNAPRPVIPTDDVSIIPLSLCVPVLSHGTGLLSATIPVKSSRWRRDAGGIAGEAFFFLLLLLLLQ